MRWHYAKALASSERAAEDGANGNFVPGCTSRDSFRLGIDGASGFAFAIGFLIGAAIGFYFISANWPYRYRKIRPMLEDDLASQIEVTSYHRTYFPNPGFVATGLTLRRKSALNLPPLGHAERMVVQGRWSDLLLLRQRVQTVEVTGLHIVVPPDRQPGQSRKLSSRQQFRLHRPRHRDRNVQDSTTPSSRS